MKHLKRSVTLFEAIMYTLCVIVGAGIYVLVGAAAGEAGNGVWLAFLFAALIAGCSGLSYAELSSKMPLDAAEYAYTERAFGSRRLAFTISWIKIVSAIIASAAVSIGFGGYFSKLLGIEPLFGSLLIILVAVLLNLYSVQKTMKLTALFVTVTILGLLLVVFSGLSYVGSVDYFDLEFGWGGIFAASALIFFAFLGFEDVANLGEEAKNPRKVLPKALMISIAVSTILYTVVALVSVSVVPWDVLSQSASPLSLVAFTTLGSSGEFLLTLIAIFATGSTVIALFFAYSRMIFGMAERNCLPSLFMRISKNGEPYMAVLVVGLVTALFALLQDIKFVASVTDFGALFVFMIINLTVLVLRYKHDHLRGEFRIPLNIGRFPILPAVGMFFCLYMLTKLDVSAAVLSLGIMIFGTVLFVLFLERRVAAPCKTGVPVKKA